MDDRFMLVGSEGCEIDAIVSSLENSVSPEVLLTTWRHVAKGLDEPDKSIYNLGWLLATSPTYSYSDAYRELFSNWKTRKGNEATLESLMESFRQSNLSRGAYAIQMLITEAELNARRSVQRMMRSSSACRRILDRRGWTGYFEPSFSTPQPQADIGHYRRLHWQITEDMEILEHNWQTGTYASQLIRAGSGVYCLDFDDLRIVAGLYNGRIKMWSRPTLRCIKEIEISKKPVRCLQFKENVLVAGDNDNIVTVCDLETGEILNTLSYHKNSVLNLRFMSNLLITLSWDYGLAVWDMDGATNINFRKVLRGHHSFVSDFDLDDKYIVSGSWDKTLKVWDTKSCELMRTLQGHEGRIRIVEFHDGKVISYDWKRNIRIWNVEASGACLVLFRYDEFYSRIHSIRFNNRHIVSGSMDGKIKIWDLKSALDPSAHSAYVYHKIIQGYWSFPNALQMDDFQVVLWSYDGTILIWNFDRRGGVEEEAVGK